MRTSNFIFCVILPMILSGIIGYFAGNVAKACGLTAELSASLAGFSGFMGAQAFNFVCLLSTRYHATLRRMRRAKKDAAAL